jgi:hypothetical protein
VRAADGNIYGIPRNATQVLRFDPRTQQATLVGDQLPGGDLKWHGGVLAADGNIYGIPLFAVQVLRFDPRTQQATLVGNQLPGGAKWHGGVLAADGNIYGIPHEATQVLRFDPRTQQATLVGAELPGDRYKWSGGVLAADGNIYGIPATATQVLRFTTPVPEGWTLDGTLAAADNVDAPPPPGDYASGGVSDAPLGVDRLGCTIYAKAIAATAREAESPSASLCVGIYARWGGGKSFLWTLVKRTLLALALVETLEKLYEQAGALTLPKDAREERAREKAAGAFKKAVAQLRDPAAKGSGMVDEEVKQRFEEQLSKLQNVNADNVGSLGQDVHRLSFLFLSFLVSVTTWCCALNVCRPASKASTPQRSTVGSKYAQLSHHEPSSLMGQLEKRLKQSREAKAAEWHAAAVALLLLLPLMLLLLLSPLLMLLLFAALLAVASRRCHKVAVTVAVADDGATENGNGDDGAAASQAEHRKRVIELLIGGPVGVGGEWGWGTIGLGEVEESTVSLITTLRYAVLRCAQSLAFCCASVHSLCTSLATCLTCTMDDDNKLPEGATKYLVVEFNAWVYSGVRRFSQPSTPTTTYSSTSMPACRSRTCCGRRSSRSSTIKWRSTSARRRCASTARVSYFRASCPPILRRSSSRSDGARCVSGA